MSSDYLASAVVTCRSVGPGPPSMVMVYRAPPDMALSAGDVGLFVSDKLKGRLSVPGGEEPRDLGIRFLDDLHQLPGLAHFAISGSDDPIEVGAALTGALQKRYWEIE